MTYISHSILTSQLNLKYQCVYVQNEIFFSGRDTTIPRIVS